MAFLKDWLLIFGVVSTVAADQELLVETARCASDILALSRGLCLDENYQEDFLTQMAIYGNYLAAVLHTLPDGNVAWLWQLNMFANTVSDTLNEDYALGNNAQRTSDVIEALTTIEGPLLSFLQINHVELPSQLQQITGDERLEILTNTINSVGELIEDRLELDPISVEICKPYNLYLGHVGSKQDKIKSLQLTNSCIVWNDVTAVVETAYMNALNEWVSPTYDHLKTYNKLLVDIVRASVYGYVKVHAALFFSYHSSVKDIYERQKNLNECYELWKLVGRPLVYIVEELDLKWDQKMTSLLKIFGENAYFEASKSDKLLKSLDESLQEISSSSNNNIILDVNQLDQLTKQATNFRALKNSVRTNVSNFIKYTDCTVYNAFKGVSFKHVNNFLNSFS